MYYFDRFVHGGMREAVSSTMDALPISITEDSQRKVPVISFSVTLINDIQLRSERLGLLRKVKWNMSGERGRGCFSSHLCTNNWRRIFVFLVVLSITASAHRAP
jgi:hypothetical protein